MKRYFIGALAALLGIALLGARPGTDPVQLEPEQFQALLDAGRHPIVLDQANRIDLRVPGTVQTALLRTGERISQVACVVVEPVSGIPKTDLRFNGNNLPVYENGNTFAPGVNSLGGILPFATRGEGSQVGDRFVISPQVEVVGEISVEFETTDTAISGALQCITLIAPAP